jgi:RNA polymerase sigma-70 factor (ECF subfamily)
LSDRASKSVAAQGQAGDENPSAPAALSFEDEALVEKCRKGDMQAFGLLVAKHQDRLVNMVHRMIGRWAEAQELAQEAFLKALERISQFRNQSSFYTWLFRIAANLAISHRRRSGRLRFGSLDEGLEGTQAHSLGDCVAQSREQSPQAVAQLAEDSKRVAEALDRLDDDYRLVIILRDMEDMDYAQISRVLDVPPGTVKSRLHRARLMLKGLLGEQA